MDDIELKIDQDNELTFDVMIEGTSNPPSVIRLMCEGNDFAYSFDGEIGDDGVSVAIPPMNERMVPGSYNARLEMVIEGRYLVPIELPIRFKEAVKVTVEGVSHNGSMLKETKKTTKRKAKATNKKSPVNVKVGSVSSMNKTEGKKQVIDSKALQKLIKGK